MALQQIYHQGLTPSSPEDGFVLIEVLASFAILSLTLIVLLQTVSRGATNARYVSAKTEALNIAQSKLASVGHDIPLRNGTAKGTTPRGLRWVMEISPYVENEPAPRAIMQGYWLSVTVFKEQSGTPQYPIISLRTMKLGRPDE